MNTTNRRGPTLLTHSFLVLVLILLLFAGCSETDDEIPKIATVKIEFTLPTPSDEVGDARNADKLDVIISTDFTWEGPGAGILYHTKHEFALTESFSQDFNLVPDDGTVELAVEIRNNTRFDELSARRIILIDGEVESDERLSITRGVWFYNWSHTKIDESVSLF